MVHYRIQSVFNTVTLQHAPAIIRVIIIYYRRWRENYIFNETSNISHLTLTLVPHYRAKIKRLIYHKTA